MKRFDPHDSEGTLHNGTMGETTDGAWVPFEVAGRLMKALEEANLKLREAAIEINWLNSRMMPRYSDPTTTTHPVADSIEDLVTSIEAAIASAKES